MELIPGQSRALHSRFSLVPCVSTYANRSSSLGSSTTGMARYRRSQNVPLRPRSRLSRTPAVDMKSRMKLESSNAELGVARKQP